MNEWREKEEKSIERKGMEEGSLEEGETEERVVLLISWQRSRERKNERGIGIHLRIIRVT